MEMNWGHLYIHAGTSSAFTPENDLVIGKNKLLKCTGKEVTPTNMACSQNTVKG